MGSVQMKNMQKDLQTRHPECSYRLKILSASSARHSLEIKHMELAQWLIGFWLLWNIAKFKVESAAWKEIQ